MVQNAFEHHIERRGRGKGEGGRGKGERIVYGNF